MAVVVPVEDKDLRAQLPHDVEVAAVVVDHVIDPALIIGEEHHRLDRTGKGMHSLAGHAVVLHDGLQGVDSGACDVAVGIDEQFGMGDAVECQPVEGFLEQLRVHTCGGNACLHGDALLSAKMSMGIIAYFSQKVNTADM